MWWWVNCLFVALTIIYTYIYLYTQQDAFLEQHLNTGLILYVDSADFCVGIGSLDEEELHIVWAAKYWDRDNLPNLRARSW
jgi:hypothetical protein